MVISLCQGAIFSGLPCLPIVDNQILVDCIATRQEEHLDTVAIIGFHIVNKLISYLHFKSMLSITPYSLHPHSHLCPWAVVLQQPFVE